jgi:hypothetical protein
MSIASYGFDGRTYVYKASLVDLYNAINTTLKQLDTESEFGKEFMRVAGGDVRKLLNAVQKNFDEWNITNTNSRDYLMSDKVWFNMNELKNRIRGANDPLSKANLVPLMEVFIIQLRRRVGMLERANISSEYTANLSDALQTTLMLIPEPKEKKIRVPDRRKNDEEDEKEQQEEDVHSKEWIEVKPKEQEKPEGPKMREITIKYEPFVEHITVAFSAAAKVQRAANQLKRETNQKKAPDDKSEGWKKVGNNKKNNQFVSK